MKFLTTLIAALSARETEGSFRALGRLVAVIVVSVAVFSIGFHEVMALEGRAFSWWSSVYWTVVTMSTLGYGDITFTSDLGRVYSLIVLLAGSVLILVLLPFTFIQVVYLPWRAAARRAGAPRQLPESTREHVILTELDPISEALIGRLAAAGVDYVLLVEDVEQGLALHDEGYRVAVGALDDPDTYRRVRAPQAALLFTSRTDQSNTNIVSTLREVAADVPAVATARSEDAVDILELVGADRVLRPGELLGAAFARRTLPPTARSSAVARFHDLVVAEATAAGTELVGRSLADLRLRQRFGVTVVALWERGRLELGTPASVVEDHSILVLVGSQEEIDAYDAAVGREAEGLADDTEAEERGDPAAPGSLHDAAATGGVIVLGGGRVGRAAARALLAAGSPVSIVDHDAARSHVEGAHHVIGDAADRDVLHEAGIDRASAVLVTTHDDDTNIYLTLYGRRLSPDIELLARVNSDRNLGTMHRAGADVVLSYASTGATEVWNVLRGESTLLLAEGLLLFRVPVPEELAGRRLRDTHVRAETGCNVVGVVEHGRTETSVDPDTVLPRAGDLVLIGTDEAEEAFLRRYVAGHHGRGLAGLVRAAISR